MVGKGDKCGPPVSGSGLSPAGGLGTLLVPMPGTEDNLSAAVDIEFQKWTRSYTPQIRYVSRSSSPNKQRHFPFLSVGEASPNEISLELGLSPIWPGEFLHPSGFTGFSFGFQFSVEMYHFSLPTTGKAAALSNPLLNMV